MKRTILFVMMASCAIAFISAQGYSEGQGQRQDQGQRRNPEGKPQLQRRHDNSRGREAAPRQRSGNERPMRRQAEGVSVSGNLSVVRGMIVVTEGETTYIIGGLNRFVGFIDGLREGAAVTLEGNAFSSPRNDSNETVKFLSVQKMTLNGKEYDLGRPAPDFQNQRNRQIPQNQMNRQMPRHGHQMPRKMPQKMHQR